MSLTESSDRVLDMVRSNNQMRLQIDEICRAHRIITDLKSRRAFGFGTLTGGLIMAAIFVAAYFMGALTWLTE